MKQIMVISLMVFVAYMIVGCQCQTKRDPRLSAESNAFIDANQNDVSIYIIRLHRAKKLVDDAKRIAAYTRIYPLLFLNVAVTRFNLTFSPSRPPVNVTVFIPSNYTTGRPVMFFYPGGGFIYSSTRLTYYPAAAHLALLTGCIVVGIDSPLAPEYKFPLGLNDAKAATEYLLNNKARISPRAVNASFGVTCDSTGCNFANVIANELTKTKIQFQILFNGLFNLNTQTPSRKEFTDIQYLMPRTFFLAIFATYFNNPFIESNSPRFNSVKGVTANSPPALLIPAELDPMRNDTDLLLKERMDFFKVPYEIKMIKGSIHGFIGNGHIFRKTVYEAALYARAFLAKF